MCSQIRRTIYCSSIQSCSWTTAGARAVWELACPAYQGCAYRGKRTCKCATGTSTDALLYTAKQKAKYSETKSSTAKELFCWLNKICQNSNLWRRSWSGIGPKLCHKPEIRLGKQTTGSKNLGSGRREIPSVSCSNNGNFNFVKK